MGSMLDVGDGVSDAGCARATEDALAASISDFEVECGIFGRLTGTSMRTGRTQRGRYTVASRLRFDEYLSA